MFSSSRLRVAAVLLAVGVVIGLSVGAVVVFVPSSGKHQLGSKQPSEQNAQSNQAALRRLDEEIRVLRAQLARLQRQSDLGATSSVKLHWDHEDAPRHAEEVASSAGEYADPGQEGTRLPKETEFAAASGFTEWSRDVEASCRELVNDNGSVKSVSCKAQICRAETEHPSVESADAFIDDMQFRSEVPHSRIMRYPIDETNKRWVMFMVPRD